MSDDYEERRAKRREEERQYRADVAYGVWRSGGNHDAVNYDRVQEYFYNGHSHEDSANAELRRQREARQREREQEYPEEQQPE